MPEKSKTYLEPGQPDYELARAMWMVRHRATAKSFNRVSSFLRKALVEDAAEVIEALEKSGFVVTHESDIDGG